MIMTKTRDMWAGRAAALPGLRTTRRAGSPGWPALGRLMEPGWRTRPRGAPGTEPGGGRRQPLPPAPVDPRPAGACHEGGCKVTAAGHRGDGFAHLHVHTEYSMLDGAA